MVTDPATGQSLAWQVEHNGAWTVELSRRGDVLGLAVYGPTDLQHGWMRTLRPGEEVVTPTAALVLSDAGWQGAVAGLTAYRRALRERTAPTTAPAPVVFNDYMNTPSWPTPRRSAWPPWCPPPPGLARRSTASTTAGTPTRRTGPGGTPSAPGSPPPGASPTA